MLCEKEHGDQHFLLHFSNVHNINTSVTKFQKILKIPSFRWNHLNRVPLSLTVRDISDRSNDDLSFVNEFTILRLFSALHGLVALQLSHLSVSMFRGHPTIQFYCRCRKAMVTVFCLCDLKGYFQTLRKMYFSEIAVRKLRQKVMASKIVCVNGPYWLSFVWRVKSWFIRYKRPLLLVYKWQGELHGQKTWFFNRPIEIFSNIFNVTSHFS